MTSWVPLLELALSKAFAWGILMNFSLKTLGSALLATVVCLPAVAQTRFCIGGDLDSLTAQERTSCSAAKAMVKATATLLNAPDNWHFVIVCGEQGWKDYTAVAQRGEVALDDSAADTDLDQHVTYLRESRMREPQTHQLQRVVAHELASIKMNTHDERLIEAQVSAWHETLNASNETGPNTVRPVSKSSSLGQGI